MMKKVMPSLAAVAAVLLSASVFAAPLNKTQVPSSTKWVFHVDFDAFRASQVGQLVQQEIHAQYQPKIDAMKLFLGSDLTADIKGLTLFGPDAEEANGVALIAGTFDREKLLSLLALNAAYAESAYGDRTIYHWRDDKKQKNQVGAFAANDLIVISQTEGGVKAVLDVLANQGGSLAKDKESTLYSLTEGTQGAFVVAAANGLSELTQHKDHAAILQNSKMMVTIADETEGTMRMFMQLEANDTQAAQQVEQVARGMLAFAALQQQKKPQLASLIGACNLSRTDSQIKFEFSYPSTKLFELLKSFTPHRAG